MQQMKYAIIAAGEGSRLAEEGVKLPKPLVMLQGEHLVERLMRIFHQHDAEEIAIIVNRLHPETQAFVEQLRREHPEWNITMEVQTTPSSMHSFAVLSPHLADAPFCLTTVDTIFREEDFAAYIAAFKQALREGYDGCMAVTDYIDDEKPLYVGVDNAMNISGFYDAYAPGLRYISGGIYALTPRALQTLERCMREGKSRMRNFQRALVADGLRLKAYVFPKILDVDHAADIQKAEDFLNGENEDGVATHHK